MTFVIVSNLICLILNIPHTRFKHVASSQVHQLQRSLYNDGLISQFFLVESDDRLKRNVSAFLKSFNVKVSPGHLKRAIL